MKFQGLDRFPAVGYMVTEKQAEVGCGFSLALHTGEPKEKILANRALLAEHFAVGSVFVGVKQVHSATVHVVTQREVELSM